MAKRRRRIKFMKKQNALLLFIVSALVFVGAVVALIYISGQQA